MAYMGRLFEIAKRTETPSPNAANGLTTIPFAEPALAPRIVSAGDAEMELEAETEHETDEDIPYIEVGPRRSMEASASVLATGPLPKTNLPKVELDEPLLVPASEAAPDAPRPLVFRPTPPEILLRRRHSKFGTELIAFHDPEDVISGQYRDLFTSMMAGLSTSRAQSLLFTSALADVPTTTVLLNLAVTAAQRGRRRVAVLDANLRQPSVGLRLGLSDATGLRQVLMGTATVDEALHKTEQDNLFALTAGVENLNGNLRFVAETVRSVVRQLRQRFDLVFVDGPMWDGKTEALQAAVACDAVFLVLPEHVADSARVEELFQEMPDKGVRLAGCVFVGR
jgi:Mrp family chromosome partitioning ATPase